MVRKQNKSRFDPQGIRDRLLARLASKGHEETRRSGKAKGMSSSGKRWTMQDRYGNTIYLAQERWEHIKGVKDEQRTDLFL